jgi:hypothetical protein
MHVAGNFNAYVEAINAIAACVKAETEHLRKASPRSPPVASIMNASQLSALQAGLDRAQDEVRLAMAWHRPQEELHADACVVSTID